MRLASEAFIRKVQPDIDFLKTSLSKLETSYHSATVLFGYHLQAQWSLWLQVDS